MFTISELQFSLLVGQFDMDRGLNKSMRSTGVTTNVNIFSTQQTFTRQKGNIKNEQNNDHLQNEQNNENLQNKFCLNII